MAVVVRDNLRRNKEKSKKSMKDKEVNDHELLFEEDYGWEDELDELADEEESFFDEEEDIEENASKTTNALQAENISSEELRYKKVKLDFNTIIPAESCCSNKLNLESGYLSVVNGGKCGYSISIAKEVHIKLKLTDTVQIGFSKDCILLGRNIPNQTVNFNLKQNGAKRIIYSANLVREITKRLGLVFGEGNKTCITFRNLDYDETLDSPIAIIRR